MLPRIHMWCVLFALCASVLSGGTFADASPGLSATLLGDAVVGALSLSAYGDALGARTELRALSGLRGDVPLALGCPHLCSLCNVSTFYTGVPGQGPQEGNPWAIWPPASLVFGMHGTITDDTYYKIGLLWPFVLNVGAGNITRVFNDSALKLWLLGPARNYRSSSWFDVGARGMSSDFLFMMNSAQIPPYVSVPPQYGRNATSFFLEGKPVCFGMYLYGQAALGLASSVVSDDGVKTVARLMANVTKLDQVWLA